MTTSFKIKLSISSDLASIILEERVYVYWRIICYQRLHTMIPNYTKYYLHLNFQHYWWLDVIGTTWIMKCYDKHIHYESLEFPLVIYPVNHVPILTYSRENKDGHHSLWARMPKRQVPLCGWARTCYHPGLAYCLICRSK